MIKLMGIPYDKNSSFLRGPAYAPARIRRMESDGSANYYAENGLEIHPEKFYTDVGDISFEAQNHEQAFHTIKSKVSMLISDGSKLVSLGGDHSVTYPIIVAHLEKYKNLHVLQLDAHGDLYEDFDGNPYSHASPFARIMETGKVTSLTQVGIRTLSNHQREQAVSFGVNCIEMKDFSLDFLSKLEGPLYISLDLDVLDPAFAPGLSHHEPGGMSVRQLIEIIQHIEVEIIGADIVEYNPVRDFQDMTAMVAYKLMKELMSKMIK
ncbi:MAG: agmatinase [Saprospiraceae bacterium]